MDRRKFVKTGAAGLAGAASLAATSPGAQELPPAGGSPRVLFHCHCFPPNESKFRIEPVDGHPPGSPAHLAGFARMLGFDYATALSPFEVPPGRCTSRVGIDDDGPAWLEAEAAGHRESLLLFASLNPDEPGSARRLIDAAGRGFRGVKFHPVICRFAIDPEKHREFYSTLERLGLPLLIHTGVFSGGEPWPLEEYHPLRIERLACMFPEIPVIIAHGGGHAFCRDVFALLQSHRNSYLDLTHTLDKGYAWHIGAREMAGFLERPGPERIIYGADYPWYSRSDLGRDIACLRELGLDNEGLDHVLGGTAARVLGLRGKEG